MGKYGYIFCITIHYVHAVLLGLKFLQHPRKLDQSFPLGPLEMDPYNHACRLVFLCQPVAPGHYS